MSSKILGIFREVDHSPNREFDDAEILRLTGRKLSEAGLEVVLKKPEEFLAEEKKWTADPPRLVFMMCEKEKILKILQAWPAATLIVNPPQAVFNTYRYLTIPKLEKAGVPVPSSEFVGAEKEDWAQSFSMQNIITRKIWIKRADVHNTQAGDVTFAASPEEIDKAMSLFRERKIARAVFQEHVSGDLIKFYGVSDFMEGSRKTSWFQWFYHKNQDLQNHPFSQEELQEVTRRAALALDLNVYGGDAIVTPEGGIFLIDINAWPSFALFRGEASDVISRFLLAKLDLLQKV